LLLGCALGSRFNRSFLARAPRFVAAVVVTVAVAMGVSVLFALTMARLTGIHPATLILATAPGGIAEMAVTAQILGLGVPMVTSFHVTRVILLLTCTGPLFALVTAPLPARPDATRPSGLTDFDRVVVYKLLTRCTLNAALLRVLQLLPLSQ